MVLKQRKQIKNLDSFNGGVDDNSGSLSWQDKAQVIGYLNYYNSDNYLSKLDMKVGKQPNTGVFSSTNDGTITFRNQSFPKVTEADAKVGEPTSKLSTDWGNVATQSVDALKSTIAGFQNYKGTNELLADAGYSTGTINGINYQQQNYVNAEAELSEQKRNAVSNTLDQMGKGAAVGANFPPFGAAIGAAVGAISGVVGGIFSRNKLKRRLNAAERMRVRKNIFNRSTAMSEGMQQDYATEYGDPSAGLLYANRGKDIG